MVLASGLGPLTRGAMQSTGNAHTGALPRAGHQPDIVTGSASAAGSWEMHKTCFAQKNSTVLCSVRPLGLSTAYWRCMVVYIISPPSSCALQEACLDK